MASKTTTSNTVDILYHTAGGASKSISVPYPDSNKTDQQIYNAAADFKNCDVLKPDGTSLATIESITLVESEKITYDLEDLAND